MVSVSISKWDIMAADRQDKLLNYILMHIGETVVKEYMEQHRDELLSMVTPELVNQILTDKIRDAIRIVERNDASSKS